MKITTSLHSAPELRLNVTPNEKGLLFKHVDPKDIEAKNFVDLCCVDQHGGLKMMASIQDGKLALICGRNRGLLRHLWHLRPFHHGKSAHALALIEDEELHDKVFTHLWVDRRNQLQVIYQQNGNTYSANLFLTPKLIYENNQLAVDIRLSPNHGAGSPIGRDGQQVPVKLLLKHGVEVNVTVDHEDPRRLSVADGKAYVPLPLSSDETVQNIKPCGSWLQVSVLKSNKKQRIFYLDSQHLELNQSSPIAQNWEAAFSDSPPVAFAHFAANNSHHFINANPFVGKKVGYIGNQHIPLSGWIDSIKHRMSSATEKWQRGRKFAAFISCAKAIDPGIQSVVNWVKERRRHRKLPRQSVQVQQRLRQHFATTKSFSELLNLDGSAHRQINREQVNAKLRQRLKVYFAKTENRRNTNSDTSVEEMLDKLLQTSHTLLNKVVLTQSVAGRGNVDPKVGDCVLRLKNQVCALRSHACVTNAVFKEVLASIHQTLETITDAQHTSFKHSEIELYLAYVERALVNVHLYVACRSNLLKHTSASMGEGLQRNEQELQNESINALRNKLISETYDELSDAIQLGYPSIKAWQQTNKVGLRLRESLDDQHKGLGKLSAHLLGKRGTAQQTFEQIIQRMQMLPKGASITLSTEQGVSGFAGFARVGIPFSPGYFAGITAHYERNYDCQLLSLGEGNTEVKFIHKKHKALVAMGGSGQGLEFEIMKDSLGPIITLLPLEVLASLKMMRDHHQSFSFHVKNEDLAKTLSYFFELEEPSMMSFASPKQNELCVKEAEYRSTITTDIEGKLSAKSQFRLQRGVGASPNLFLVAPRFEAGLGEETTITRRQKRAIVIGDKSRFHAQADWTFNVERNIGLGTSVLVIPLTANCDYAFPVPIDEKMLASTTPRVYKSSLINQYNHHQSHQELPLSTLHGLNGALDAQAPATMIEIDQIYQHQLYVGQQEGGVQCESMSNLQRSDSCQYLIENLHDWLHSRENSNNKMKARVANIVSQLLQAEELGYHQVEKEIAANDIEHLKVSYEQNIRWYTRWLDHCRRHIRIQPKHSQSLPQAIESNQLGLGSEGHKLLKLIKASSQSQSQLLNNGRESSVIAKAKYRIALPQLKALTNQLISALHNCQSEKEAYKKLVYFDKLLARHSQSQRSQFQLAEIAFERRSSMSLHPSGILPLIHVKQKSQVTMVEPLGELLFRKSATDVKKGGKRRWSADFLTPSLFSVYSD